MRRSLFLFLLFIVAFLFMSGQAGAMETHAKIDVKMKNFSIEKEGHQYYPQKPLIMYNSTRYLPLRYVMELSNKQVFYNSKVDVIRVENSYTNQIQPFRTYEQMNKNLTFDDQIKAKGAVVIEDKPGQVMFGKNAYEKFYPASTVKIMTALLAIQEGDLNEKVVVTDNIKNLPWDSRLAYIQPGDTLTLEQLLYGMLVYSGNDCALAIAEHIGGSEEKFVQMMNEKAKELGAVNTHFMNPHGYHHPNQYTTPYELALIMREAAKLEVFRNIIHTSEYEAVYKNKNGKQVVRHWDTTNDLLTNNAYEFEGIIGSKTGYTDASKHNLVTLAKRNGHLYISVILKGDRQQRYRDTLSLLNNAINTRRNYDSTIEKTIQVSFNESIVVNGNKLERDNNLFVYNSTAYVSEQLAKIIFKSDQNFFEFKDYRLKFADKVYVQKKMKQINPFFLFGTISPTSNVLAWEIPFHYLDYLTSMYTKVDFPFFPVKVETLLVKQVNPSFM